MKIQVNSDKQVKVDAAQSDAIKAAVETALQRFEGQLTRIEVHLSDLNSSKPGLRDKRCLLEARPAGKQPVSADFTAGTVEQAVRGAAGKMKRLLETAFGKGAHQTSRESLGKAKSSVRSVRTLDKMERIEASLAEILAMIEPEQSTPAGKHVQSAAESLRKARALAADNAQPAKRRRAFKTTPAKGKPAAGGRSPKKKAVSRARRKAWPKR